MPRVYAECGARCNPRPTGCGECRQAASYTRPTYKVCDSRCFRTPDGLCGVCRREKGADALVARCSICERPIPARRDRCGTGCGEAVPA